MYVICRNGLSRDRSLLEQWELLDVHCRRQLQLQLHFLDTRTRTVFLVMPVTFRLNSLLGYSSAMRYASFRHSDSFDFIPFSNVKSSHAIL